MVNRVVFDRQALQVLTHSTSNPQLRNLMSRLAATIEQGQKRRCPVSPVFPVYATGGATVPGGRRHAGDFPLRPSGYLRSSIVTREEPGSGDLLIGPTADYAVYVDQGTRPHEIHSHGPWPLRNRATGQVFGQSVHHPGSKGVFFIERSLDDVRGGEFHL